MLHVDADISFKQMTQPRGADLAIVCEFRECAKWVVIENLNDPLNAKIPLTGHPNHAVSLPTRWLNLDRTGWFSKKVFANQKIVESEQKLAALLAASEVIAVV